MLPSRPALHHGHILSSYSALSMYHRTIVDFVASWTVFTAIYPLGFELVYLFCGKFFLTILPLRRDLRLRLNSKPAEGRTVNKPAQTILTWTCIQNSCPTLSLQHIRDNNLSDQPSSRLSQAYFQTTFRQFLKNQGSRFEDDNGNLAKK